LGSVASFGSITPQAANRTAKPAANRLRDAARVRVKVPGANYPNSV